MAPRITQLSTQALAEGDANPRITSLPVQALADSDGNAAPRITSLPIQVLAGIDVVPRITNFMVQALIEVEAFPRIQQLMVYALAKPQQCMAFKAQSWRIERRDGTVHLFTSHDQPITFRDEVYQPCGSIDPSAYQSGGQFGDVGNANLVGLLSLDGSQPGILSRDIAAGLLDSAVVEVWDLPWQGDEHPYPILKGFIGTITQNDINYAAELVTYSSLLSNRGVLEAFTPNCRFMLGDARCTVNLAGFTDTGFVTEQAAGSTFYQAGKRQFIDISRIEADDYWTNGIVTWTSGNNAGYSSEVAQSTDDGIITLWNVMPHKIELNDNYTIVAGCDKKLSTCKDKFNNVPNFGGFPDIPGNDIILQTPDAKQ